MTSFSHIDRGQYNASISKLEENNSHVSDIRLYFDYKLQR